MKKRLQRTSRNYFDMSTQMQQWHKFKLSDLGTVARGRSRHRPRNDASLFGGKYPFIQTGDIKAANFYITKYSQTYNEKGLAQSRLWEAETLCITIAANIGESAILEFPACFPDSVVGFHAHKDVSDVRYVKYLLDYTKSQFQAISRGTTQDNLSLEKLLSINLLVPEYSLQKKIADFLVVYDRLFSNNNRRLEIITDLIQGAYHQWFVKNAQQESTAKLGDLVKIKGGLYLKKEMYADVGMYPVFGGNGIQGFSDKFNYDSFVIILGRVGANCGSIHWSYEPVWLNNNSAGIIPKDKEFNEYILQFLLNYDFSQVRGGSAQPFISNTALGGITVPIPSEKQLNKFSEFVRPLRLEYGKLQLMNANLNRIKNMLIPKVTTGEIKV